MYVSGVMASSGHFNFARFRGAATLVRGATREQVEAQERRETIALGERYATALKMLLDRRKVTKDSDLPEVIAALPLALIEHDPEDALKKATEETMSGFNPDVASFNQKIGDLGLDWARIALRNENLQKEVEQLLGMPLRKP